MLLLELGADSQDREARLMYFIGRLYSQGVSPSGIGRNLSALAFWFKIRGERYWTKCFLCLCFSFFEALVFCLAFCLAFFWGFSYLRVDCTEPSSRGWVAIGKCSFEGW